MNAIVTQISKACLIAGALMVSACGQSDADKPKNQATNAAKENILDGKVECALAGSATYTRNCQTERVTSDKGQMLIIRHPDGGFRRFMVLTDGRGLSPADGFDKTDIAILEGGFIEVSSGDDKYRLPAEIKAKPPEPATPAAPDTDLTKGQNKEPG